MATNSREKIKASKETRETKPNERRPERRWRAGLVFGTTLRLSDVIGAVVRSDSARTLDAFVIGSTHNFIDVNASGSGWGITVGCDSVGRNGRQLTGHRAV